MLHVYGYGHLYLPASRACRGARCGLSGLKASLCGSMSLSLAVLQRSMLLSSYAAFTGAAYMDYSDQDWSIYFDGFRNAQITLRILIICASYPFLLCLCFCSTYVLTLHILFTLTSFWFWHAFCFIRTAIRAAGGFQARACQKGGCSTRSYSSIFHRFYFSLTGYFYFRRVVRNDSLVRRLRRQRSRPCAVGR